MAYQGLSHVLPVTEPHLGGTILEGDPYSFSPNAWNYALTRFGISSVLDIGSGLGYAAQYFHSRGQKVIAIDGLQENCDSAIYPTVKLDLTLGPINCRVDFVHCQEVVEHIEEKYVDNLLRSLACGKFILITHATPGQGGHHHVNEQPPEYWISQLKRFNCHYIEDDTARIRRFAEIDNALYLARTGMLFANRGRIGGR